MKMQGIYIPLITPMIGDHIDYSSYEKLINHYISQGVSGIIPLGTTGESPTIDPYEIEKLISLTVQTVDNRVPIYFGYSGNYTQKMIKGLKNYEGKGLQGLLMASPYYNRPSQNGLYEHFKAIANSTNLDIILYNIPYRTGRNIENATLRKLSDFNNIVALKDASGNMTQTTDLLINRPDNLSILTGEDYHLFSTLALGGDGGILASAHINTTAYIKLYEAIQRNDLIKALSIWKSLAKYIPLLFKEPNPAPLKYILKKQGLIISDNLRLPLTSISQDLQKIIDSEITITV